MLDLTGANETDVREEVAAPMLKLLGYARGTNCDIAREPTLSYERHFLGRKKQTDPPLRGRADYILSVVGVARWVLEIKGPSEPIDIDAIEQAISYAKHPEISASYAVVLNGREVTVHHASQRSIDVPLLQFQVTDVNSLAEKLGALLSPASIRRDCSPPMLDVARPLATGLRSNVDILRGDLTHHDLRWRANVPLLPEAVAGLDELRRRVQGLKVAVTGGSIGRDAASRIRAKLVWSLPHDQILQFALDKRLMDSEYIALAEVLSRDAEHPTLFDVVGMVEVRAGEPMFNIVSWTTEAAGIETKMSYAGSATGYLEDYEIKGSFESTYRCIYPAIPGLELEMEMEGSFRVELDRR